MITLAEAFAVLLARVVLRDCIKKRRVLFFVDNEGARHSLIKGCSPTLALLQIVQLFHACGEHDQCIAWIERVPSSSNIADLPSRDKTNIALELIGGLPWPFPCDVEAVVSLCMSFSALPSLLTMLAFDQEIPAVCPSAHDGFTGPGHVLRKHQQLSWNQRNILQPNQQRKKVPNKLVCETFFP